MESNVDKLYRNLINDKPRKHQDIMLEFNRRRNTHDRDTHRNLIKGPDMKPTAKKHFGI